MKNMKIIPLLMVFPLLAACNGNNVKSMKKPSFAAYSNKVAEKYDFYEHYEKAGEEMIKANFVMDGQQIVSLDKGAVLSSKGYQAIEFSSKLANGNKQSASAKQYVESKAEFSAENLVGKQVSEMNLIQKYTNMDAVEHTYGEVGGNPVVYLYSLPQFMSGNTEIGGGLKMEEYVFFKDNKTAEANGIAKTYSVGSLVIAEEAQRKALLATEVASTCYSEATGYAPSDSGSVNYDRYEDGKVFTSVFKGEAKAIKITYSSGKEYTVNCKYEQIYQANFDKLTFSSSEEVTIDMSGAAGTYKYSYKSYQVSEMANKKVNVKAPDLSKYVEVTSDQ